MDTESPLPPLSPADVDPDDAVALWRGCILNTWADAFQRSDGNLLTIDRRCEPEGVRSSARNWLVSDMEPWREDREYVADLAGIDPDALRRIARERIRAGRADDEARENEARREAIQRMDSALEKLLAESAGLSKKMLNRRLGILAENESAAL